MVKQTQLVSAGLAMIVIMIAGVGKLLSLPEFVDSLESWTVIPPIMRAGIGTFVPVSEILISGAWFIGIRRLLVQCLAVMLIALFTAGYLLEWIANSPPDCQCLGRLIQFQEAQWHAWSALVRNAILLGLLLFGLIPSNQNYLAA